MDDLAEARRGDRRVGRLRRDVDPGRCSSTSRSATADRARGAHPRRGRRDGARRPPPRPAPSGRVDRVVRIDEALQGPSSARSSCVPDGGRCRRGRRRRRSPKARLEIRAQVDPDGRHQVGSGPRTPGLLGAHSSASIRFRSAANIRLRSVGFCLPCLCPGRVFLGLPSSRMSCCPCFQRQGTPSDPVRPGRRTPLIRLAGSSATCPASSCTARRVREPGRVGQGSAGPADDLEGLASGALAPGKVAARRDLGQYRHRLRDARRRARLPVTLCVPENVTPERKRMLQRLRRRARAHRSARRARTARSARRGGCSRPTRTRYFYPDQYNNEFNWRAHYDTTAPGDLEQTAGRLTHFVAGLGTSGTFVGVGRRLREVLPGVVLVSVQPDARCTASKA